VERTKECLAKAAEDGRFLDRPRVMVNVGRFPEVMGPLGTNKRRAYEIIQPMDHNI